MDEKLGRGDRDREHHLLLQRLRHLGLAAAAAIVLLDAKLLAVLAFAAGSIYACLVVYNAVRQRGLLAWWQNPLVFLAPAAGAGATAAAAAARLESG